MNWVLLIAMSLITFGNRYAFFSEFVRFQPGERLKRFLSYSSYAILTAIWAPILIRYDGATSLDHAGLDYLVAAAVAALLAFLKLPSIVVVVVSTALFFLLRAFL